MRAARKRRDSQRPQALIDHVRQSLTPPGGKQARRARPRRRAAVRRDLQPRVPVMMAMTRAAGDSRPETSEAARGFYVAGYRARTRPGRTLEGSQKAPRRVPPRPLRTPAAGVRPEIRARSATRLLVDGFEPIGRDGSRIEGPRSAELEARRGRAGPGRAGKRDAAPTLRVTAFVHPGTGLLRSWRPGPGTAAEPEHLRHLLATLSPRARIVCDAAYMGYEPVPALLQAERSSLFRMSSKVHLDTPGRATLKDGSEGPVPSWPEYARRQGLAPIHGRLIRAPATGRARKGAGLRTDVLDATRLPLKTAAKSYRWRWRNEGVFRIYERAAHELKRPSRTVRLAHREAGLSSLATQILLAHADLALRAEAPATAGGAAISPRQALREIRKGLKGAEDRRAAGYRRRLRGCRAEARHQKSPEAARDGPRREPHQPPRPPTLHTLTDEQEAVLEKQKEAA